MSLFDLPGRVAIVTGAITGVGQAIAVALAAAGADVALFGRMPPTETALRITVTGRHSLSISDDRSTIDGVNRIVAATRSSLGGLDILVNNVGVIRCADSVDLTEADWDMAIDTNLKSVLIMAQATGKHMISQGKDKMINVASMRTFEGGIGVPCHTASKSGVVGLTKLLANEWVAKAVHVNAIAPGYIATNTTDALRADPARNASLPARIPAARWGDSANPGGPAVFVASDASNYVGGHILAVDGGGLAR